MSESLLSRTLLNVAQALGDRLPAAYGLEPGEVLITGDPDSHGMPEEAVALRWALGDEDGFLIVALTPDAAELLGPDNTLMDVLSAVVADIGVPLAPLFSDIPPMIGPGEELPADEILANGPGDAVSVSLADGGVHRVTVGLRLVVTDEMMRALPEAESDAFDDDPQDVQSAVDAEGMASDADDAVLGAGSPTDAEEQMALGEFAPQGVNPLHAAGGPAFPQGAPGLIGSRAPAPRRGMSSPVQMPMGEAHPADFASFDMLTALPGNGHPMSLLGDVEMGVTAELGRTELTVRDVLSLTPGAIIELDRAAGSPVDVVVNGTLIARGEVVVIDEEFGIRITEILGMADEVNPFPMAQ